MLPERRYDLDWMRAIAILILLLFHSGMLFNTWDWHIKNPETSVAFNYWMVWSHFTRMPLLLFISGAGTVLAFAKRSPGQYLLERTRRLMVPVLLGFFVIVPPQIYFERIHLYSSYLEFYRTVFNFIPYPEGSFSWHHLWFIVYLFLYSLICLPFVLLLKRSVPFADTLQRIFRNPAGLIGIPWIAIIGSQLLLGTLYPDETHDLINDWAFFTYYGLFFLFGIVCFKLPEVWESIRKYRKLLLVISILFIIPFYIVYLHFREVIELSVTMDTAEDIFDVLAFAGSWVWVLTLCGYAQYYLNKPWSGLKYINEGLYPFYILHQTVIIALGYYICQTSLGIPAKYLLVVLGTAVICILIFMLLIRPFNAIRILFGMNPKRKSIE